MVYHSYQRSNESVMILFVTFKVAKASQDKLRDILVIGEVFVFQRIQFSDLCNDSSC